MSDGHVPKLDREALQERLWAEYPWTRFVADTPEFEAMIDAGLAQAESLRGGSMSGQRIAYPGTETEAVWWVTVSRPSKHFHGAPTPPVLHRESCRYAQKALANGNAAREYDEPRTPEWVRNNGRGFERSCRVCCPDFEILPKGLRS